jgi:hypothetical protein
VRPVALACLLLTAGCLGFLGNGTASNPTASGATQPASSPTATPSPTGDLTSTATVSPIQDAVRLPTNLTGHRIGSAEGVAATHEATLWNTSFTARYSRVWIADGEVSSWRSRVVRYDGAGTVYTNFTTVDFDAGSVIRTRTEQWSNGSTARRAVVTANGTAVEDVRPIANPPTYADRIAVYLRSFRMSTTGWSRLGGELITRARSGRLNRGSSPAGDAVADLEFLVPLWEITGGRFSADVTERTVRRYRSRLVGYFQSERVVLVEEFHLSAVGTTTVDRPAWVTAENGSLAR